MVKAGNGADGAPKLLFLCQTLPYPPDSGVAIRSYHTLRELSRGFDIRGICFYRKDLATRDIETSVSALRELADVEVYPIPQEHDPLRLLWDHARSVTTGTVYTRYVYESTPAERELRRLLRAETFDLAHVDSLDLSGYLPRLEGMPVVCVHHNIESRLLRRRAATEDSPLRAAYMRHQARLMEREERAWCERVQLNVTVSEEESERLQELVPGARCRVFPNGVDIERFTPGGFGGRGIVSIGGVEWFPNRDALEHFSNAVFPRIRARLRESPRVRWIGRCPDEIRPQYEAGGIDLTGYLEDIRPELRRGACFVVPLRVGGGTRLKILTAWAMGLAVVSTSVGCEGLDVTDEGNILIRDDPDAFADAVVRVLGDEDLRRRLGRAGRETVEASYSWKSIGRGMRAEYRELLEAGGRRQRSLDVGE